MPRETWRRYLAWLALAVAFAIACVALSQWQFARREEAVARIKLVEDNYDRNPAQIAELSDALERPEGPQELHWRPVLLEGRYLVAEAVLVRNRPLNGQPGFVQLVPFQTLTGSVLAIERGWLPTGSRQDAPDVNPQPESLLLEVTARIRPIEADLGRQAPEGQIAAISEAELKRAWPTLGIETDYYLRVAVENPAQPRPIAIPKPSPNEGNHLSYAVQWLIFAAMAFGALYWAVRQEVRLRREAAGGAPAKSGSGRRTRAQVDEETEDSLTGG